MLVEASRIWSAHTSAVEFCDQTQFVAGERNGLLQKANQLLQHVERIWNRVSRDTTIIKDVDRIVKYCQALTNETAFSRQILQTATGNQSGSLSGSVVT